MAILPNLAGEFGNKGSGHNFGGDEPRFNDVGAVNSFALRCLAAQIEFVR
jgi:hypothetical protein